MDRTSLLRRRDFVRLGASAAALSAVAGWSRDRASASPAPAPEGGVDPWRGLKVGIATYTFSKLPLEATIKGIKQVGLKYASLKESHLALKSTAGERKAVVKKFQDAGITLLSCGVVNMTDDEAAIRNAFEYARDCGIPTIVCKPTPASLPLLDSLVKSHDVKLAIHNHGPEDKVWPSPLGVWDALQKYDERMGLCIDVGHTARCGVDPAGAIRTCAPRLYDVHFKDIADAQGKSRPVEVGRGVLDTRAILKALLDAHYPYHVGLEYEKDMADPLAGVAESIGYVRGVLSDMKG